MTDIDPEVSYKIHDALAGALHDETNPGILNRWILMSEHVFPGGSTVSYVTSPGLSTWEVLGMIESTKAVAKEHLLSIYEDDDEDED